MDISAEREREMAEAAAEQAPRPLTRDELDRAIISFRQSPDDLIEFTPEQVQRVVEADQFTQRGVELLGRMSTPEAPYSIPEDIEGVALRNALLTLLVEKEIVTMAEVFVAKREAIAELMENVVNAAKMHKQQQSMALVGVDPETIAAVNAQRQGAKPPPPPPRKQQRRRGR